MYNDKTFRVEHSTGYIEVNVGKFFGTSDKRTINKLLRLAKQHCTEEHREELLSNLQDESVRRKEVLDTLGAMAVKREELLSCFFNYSVKFALTGPEKALVKQCEKIALVADKVKKERWNS
ncbi:MAG: hypothetical protein RR365_08940 [Bacteroides sp.]